MHITGLQAVNLHAKANNKLKLCNIFYLGSKDGQFTNPVRFCFVSHSLESPSAAFFNPLCHDTAWQNIAVPVTPCLQVLSCCAHFSLDWSIQWTINNGVSRVNLQLLCMNGKRKRHVYTGNFEALEYFRFLSVVV